MGINPTRPHRNGPTRTAWATALSAALLAMATGEALAQQPAPVPDGASADSAATVTATPDSGPAEGAVADAPVAPPAEPLAVVPVGSVDPDADVGTRQDASGSVLLDTVVVTARKRKEPLQDVPMAVSAFSAAQLDARGAVNIRDLGTIVPGLQFTDLAGYNLIYLRGIGTDAFIPSADPSVATYLDGVYFPSAHSVAQSFGALDRIEVLKGPQGTLFGRNSTGGAISIFTADPGPEAETSIQASYGRFNDSKTRVYTNIPIGDHLAASISAFYNRADNYYDYPSDSDRSLPTEINKGARLKLGIYPSDDLSIVLTGMLMQQSGTSTTTSANTHPSALLGALIPAETREYVVTADSQPSLVSDTEAFYATATWKQPWFDTKLMGSYYFVNAHDYVYDFDGSALPIATYGADSDFQRIKTAELQFTSNASSWGSDRFKWVGGFYYLKSRGGYNPGYLGVAQSVIDLPTEGVTDLLSNVIGRLPPVLRDPLLAVPLPSSLTFYFTGLIGAESYSGYAQGTYSLTDWLDITAGGRYQRETRSLIKSTVGFPNIGGGLTNPISFAPRESTNDNFSPRITLDVRPVDNLLLYGSFAQGIKSATYNIINIYQQPDYVKPEKVTTWEVGVKSDWFGRKLRVNAAAFDNRIKNLQTAFVSLTSGGAVNFENADARSRGVEVDATAQILGSWDPGLVLTASATWLDATYTDYSNGSGYREDNGLSFESDCSNPDGPQCMDFTGNRVVRTPKFSGDVGLSQTLELGAGQLEVAADYYYNSGYYYLAQNSPNSFEDAYGLINARIGYLYRPWHTRLTVYGQNLGDTRYNLAQFHTDFGRQDTLAPPVSYGIRINVDF